MFMNVKNVKIDLPQFVTPWLINCKDEIRKYPSYTGSETTETNTDDKFEILT